MGREAWFVAPHNTSPQLESSGSVLHSMWHITWWRKARMHLLSHGKLFHEALCSSANLKATCSHVTVVICRKPLYHTMCFSIHWLHFVSLCRCMCESLSVPVDSTLLLMQQSSPAPLLGLLFYLHRYQLIMTTDGGKNIKLCPGERWICAFSVWLLETETNGNQMR